LKERRLGSADADAGGDDFVDAGARAWFEGQWMWIIRPAGVRAVADRVAYESEAAFSRAYQKKVVGMPPSQWRRRRRHWYRAQQPWAML